MSLLGCCAWSLRHFGHPILKAFEHVLCKQTKVDFYLCSGHRKLTAGLYFCWLFIEFIIKCYINIKSSLDCNNACVLKVEPPTNPFTFNP